MKYIMFITFLAFSCKPTTYYQGAEAPERLRNGSNQQSRTLNQTANPANAKNVQPSEGNSSKKIAPQNINNFDTQPKSEPKPKPKPKPETTKFNLRTTGTIQSTKNGTMTQHSSLQYYKTKMVEKVTSFEEVLRCTIADD